MEPSIPAALLAVALLVKVPFDFRAGGTRLPPGEYVVATDGTSSVTIKERAQKKSAVVGVVRSSDSRPPGSTTVSFRAYGDRRFLASIEVEGGGRWDVPTGVEEVAGTRARPTITSLKAQALEWGSR